jgi:hypothetical protein
VQLSGSRHATKNDDNLRRRDLYEYKSYVRTLAVAVILCISQAGCFATAIGNPGHENDWTHYQFGPNEQINICTYRDEGVSSNEVTDWIQNWNAKHERQVAITLIPIDKGELPRDGFTHYEISNSFDKEIALTEGCDRDIYFVGRTFADFLYGVLAFATVPLPETLGETDDLTLTHAFIVARRATVMNLVFPPEDITEHELWHLLGCKQHYNWDRCYAQVEALKEEHRRLVDSGYFREVHEQPFYPTWDNMSDRFLVRRAEVNSHFEH